MKYRYIFTIAIINFILSSTLFQILRINGALPNFCIIISIILASLGNSRQAYLFALVSGLMQDLFLGRMIGINLLIYGLIVLITINLIEIMFKGNFITPVFLIVIGTVFYHFLFYIIMFFVQSTIPFELMATKIGTEVIYNGIIGYLIYSKAFKKVHGYKLGDFNA